MKKLLQDFFKPGKSTINIDDFKKTITKEIDHLPKSNDIIIKPKELDREIYLNVIYRKEIIEKHVSPQRISTINIPDLIGFLILIDPQYPIHPPKVLAKTNFSTPKLMDGRDLLSEILPNWNKHCKLENIITNIPKFVGNVLNAMGYKFYGQFHLGATYLMKNFEHMVVSYFSCKANNDITDKSKANPPILKTNRDYMLILTDDALLLFDVMLSTGNGTLVFWSSLYSISAVRLDKMNQKASFTIFNNDNNNEYYLHLNFEKILHFRDALVKKMRTLKIKNETIRVMKGQSGNRFTKKEINSMKLEDVEKAIDDLEKRIRKGEINDYTVNTFSVLCGKAMEELAQIGSPNFEKYLKLMQEVLGLDEVKTFTEKAQEEMKNMDGKE